ncbi:TPA: hypothetical protein PXM28_001491 [Yersinia enterocolitica]|nr:hypothetical protein [Yersinia enterocolitica]
MPASLTASIASGSAGVVFAALFPDASPAVIMCALAGATLYILSTDNHKLWKQMVYALISFIGGVNFAGTASDIIAAMINANLSKLDPPVTITVSPAIGALVASVICVTALLHLLSRAKKSDEEKK